MAKTAATLGPIPSLAIPAIVVLGYVGYVALRSIYRLCFHPLKNVPGPKLAAVTSWYEFYWDCIKHGQYFKRVQEMHKQYGTFHCGDVPE